MVELYLADCVNEKGLRAGHPAVAWASQRTLAKKCRCSRSTVQDALEELQLLGRITDTGERKQRGTVVWELHLTADRSSQAGDRTGQRSSPDEWTEDRSSGDDDWTDPARDWTDPRADWTGDRSGTGPETGHKPEGNRKLKPEYEPEPRDGARARDRIYRGAEGKGNSDDGGAGLPLSPAPATQTEQRQRALARKQAEERSELEADLAKLEEQAPTSLHPEQTRKAIEELRARLAAFPAAEAAT